MTMTALIVTHTEKARQRGLSFNQSGRGNVITTAPICRYQNEMAEVCQFQTSEQTGPLT